MGRCQSGILRGAAAGRARRMDASSQTTRVEPIPAHSRLRLFVLLSSATCILVSTVVLAAWQFDLLILARLDSGYVPMTIAASLVVLLLSMSLLVEAHVSQSKVTRTARALLGGTALVLITYVLIEPALHLGFDLESFLYGGTETSEGYLLADTSPLSAASLALASFAAVLATCPCARNRAVRAVVPMISLAVFFVGLVTMLGYAYGSPLLYGGEVRPAALLSGVSLMLISSAQVAAQGPDRWPLAMFVGRSVEAKLLRTFVPFVALVVLVSGSLSSRALSQSANPALTASLLAILTAIVVGAAVVRLSRYIGGQIDRTEALRQEAERNLQMANEKLTVLGSLTRHDALNQLAVVLGRLELVKMTSRDPKVLKQVEESLESANAIRAMLEFTGQYQNIGMAGPAWIDVPTAFAGAVHSLDPERVKAVSEVDGIEILADIMFEKVLSNLVDNSVRHGERVTTVRLGAEVSLDHLVLVYEDDGVGLSEEDKANLFRRGFGKHTGFGMYLSKEILEFSGLGIRETGLHGRGARFEITVPEGKYRLGRTDI